MGGTRVLGRMGGNRVLGRMGGNRTDEFLVNGFISYHLYVHVIHSPTCTCTCSYIHV